MTKNKHFSRFGGTFVGTAFVWGFIAAFLYWCSLPDSSLTAPNIAIFVGMALVFGVIMLVQLHRVLLNFGKQLEDQEQRIKELETAASSEKIGPSTPKE